MSPENADSQAENQSFGVRFETSNLLNFPGGASGKEPACQCRRRKRHRSEPWVRKIPLEEGIATHSSNLAWRIPWTEEPGGLQSMRLQRVGHMPASCD